MKSRRSWMLGKVTGLVMVASCATSPARPVEFPSAPAAATSPSGSSATLDLSAQSATSTAGPVSERDARAFEKLVLRVLKERNFATLARLVHPSKGVTLTAGLMFSVNNITLTQDEVRGGATDPTVRSWGLSMAGDSVHETIAQHFGSIFGDYNDSNALFNQSTDPTHQTEIGEHYPGAAFVDINDTSRRNGPVVFNTIVVIDRDGDKLALVGIIADR